MKKLILTILIIIQCSLLGATIINVPDSCATIQLAIDIAADGDTILVQPGTYTENITIERKALTIGSLFLTEGDSSYIEQTIIDGNQNGRVIAIIGHGPKDSAFPVVVCGFTITNGIHDCGGGIFLSSPTVIKNNIIQHNVAKSGGGIHVYYTKVDIENTIIRYNGYSGDGAQEGGGVWSLYSSVTMRGCDISENALDIAGGIRFWMSDFIIEECTINNNVSYKNTPAVCITRTNKGIIRNSEISSNIGGGIYVIKSNVDFYNLLVTNNLSSCRSGIELNEGLNYSFVNCTVANNISAADSGYGGGLSVGYMIYANLTNCIFYGNSFNQISQRFSEIEIEYSDIQGGKDSILVESSTLTWGEGNINADPLFVGGSPYSYQLLSSSSPCINAGTPDTTGLHLPLTDLAGNPRVLYGRIDMGAYECENFSVDPRVSVDEGVSLYQNSPNPFRNGTEISFTVKDFSHIDDYSISIYNTKGQLVRTFAGKSNTEMTKIAWDGTDGFGKQTSPGVYLYKLEYGEQEVVRKMVKLH